MKEFKVEIKGVTPLLFNRFMESSIDTEVKKRPGAVKSDNIEDKLYKLPDGKIYTPSTHISGMLVNAAKEFKIRGKGKATYSKIVGSTMEVSPDAIVHINQSWEEYAVSGVNPNTRGRTMIRRPMMKEWALEFNVKFNEDDIPVEVVKNILDHGGQYVGIGDWRPANKGKFGKFMITKFEEIEE
jgi:hypothetical protein